MRTCQQSQNKTRVLQFAETATEYLMMRFYIKLKETGNGMHCLGMDVCFRIKFEFLRSEADINFTLPSCKVINNLTGIYLTSM